MLHRVHIQFTDCSYCCDSEGLSWKFWYSGMLLTYLGPFGNPCAFLVRLPCSVLDPTRFTHHLLPTTDSPMSGTSFFWRRLSHTGRPLVAHCLDAESERWHVLVDESEMDPSFHHSVQCCHDESGIWETVPKHVKNVIKIANYGFFPEPNRQETIQALIFCNKRTTSWNAYLHIDCIRNPNSDWVARGSTNHHSEAAEL